MREVWLIWRAWFLGKKNTLQRRQPGQSVFGGAWGLILALALGFLICFGAIRLLGSLSASLAGLEDSARLWRMLCLNLSTGLALATFIFFFLTSLGTVTATFLEAGNLEFLLAQPVRTRAVFGAKFGEAWSALTLATAPLILPTWFALGAVNRAGAAFYLTAIACYICAEVIFLGPITLGLLAVMRFIRRQRLRQLLVSLGLLGALLVVFGTQYLNAWLSSSLSHGTSLHEIQVWGLAKLNLLPHAWMGRAPLATLGWPGLSLLDTLGPLVVVALLVVLVSLLLGERIFLAGWSSAQEYAGNRRPVEIEKPFSGRGRRGKGRPIGALLAKELRLVRREPLLWYNGAAAALIMGFFVWNMSRAGIGGEAASRWLIPVYAGMAVLATASWNGQIGGVSVSREGGSWWVLQMAPLKPEEVLIAKFGLAFLPQALFILAAHALLAIIPGVPGYRFLPAAPISLAIAAVVSAISLLTDVLRPNFRLKLEGRWSGGKNVGGGKVAITSLIQMAAIFFMTGTMVIPTLLLKPGLAGWAAGATLAAETAGGLLFAWLVGVPRVKRLLTDGG